MKRSATTGLCSKKFMRPGVFRVPLFMLTWSLSLSNIGEAVSREAKLLYPGSHQHQSHIIKKPKTTTNNQFKIEKIQILNNVLKRRRCICVE